LHKTRAVLHTFSGNTIYMRFRPNRAYPAALYNPNVRFCEAKIKGGWGAGGGREKEGQLCDIRRFDFGDLAVELRGFPVKFFTLDFENKFSCFFGSGERFFLGLTLDLKVAYSGKRGPHVLPRTI
jgi:hypothetical protein